VPIPAPRRPGRAKARAPGRSLRLRRQSGFHREKLQCLAWDRPSL
jgi:hypothetical protein